MILRKNFGPGLIPLKQLRGLEIGSDGFDTGCLQLLAVEDVAPTREVDLS